MSSGNRNHNESESVSEYAGGSAGEWVGTEILDFQCRRDPLKRQRITNNIVKKSDIKADTRIAGDISWYGRIGKRIVDIVGAFILLAMLFPFFLALAVCIKLDSPGPVFFRQKRTGLLGRRFSMWKFRTMVKDAEAMKEKLRHLSHHAADSPDFKIANDPRISRIGRYLRKSSLDELPNLINVIIGDMSLVGPRPTSFDFDTYHDNHLARLAVKPGMTGLWQISGRSELDFDERVRLDQLYIEKQSFWFDMEILLKTPFKVISGRGAY